MPDQSGTPKPTNATSAQETGKAGHSLTSLRPHSVDCPMLWHPDWTPEKSQRCVRCGQEALLAELARQEDSRSG